MIADNVGFSVLFIAHNIAFFSVSVFSLDSPSFFLVWLLREILFPVSLPIVLCSSSVIGLFVFGFPIERNAALKQLVSTSTLVFLTSAAGPPIATAAALLPFSDGRNNSSNGSRSSQPAHNRKYPLLKRESSISLESASALMNSHGSVKSRNLFPLFPSCVLRAAYKTLFYF